jgi:hypothetical protein
MLLAVLAVLAVLGADGVNKGIIHTATSRIKD